MKAFDRKFGEEFTAGLPQTPGVYLIYNDSSDLIYVGKAKNLRRRLSQYRNAKRRKKDFKMRAIVSEAVRIEILHCESDRDACLLEARMIQNERPKWNVAGAFSFLYPMIGIQATPESGDEIAFCFTTSPKLFPQFAFHGAFRSRHWCGNAFFSLMKLLDYVGHRSKSKKPLPKFSYVYRFRHLPREWVGTWEQFFRGESKTAMEELVLALVENAGARRKSDKIQALLNDVARFWRFEAVPLRKAREAVQFEPYPVSQEDRDFLFLKYRFSKPAKPVRKPRSNDRIV